MLDVLGDILELRRGCATVLVPIVQNFGGSVAATDAKCKAERQSECTDRCHEQRIDEFTRDTNLVDRHYDRKCPHCNASNIGQQIRHAKTSLRSRTTHKTGKRICSQATDYERH